MFIYLIYAFNLILFCDTLLNINCYILELYIAIILYH